MLHLPCGEAKDKAISLVNDVWVDDGHILGLGWGVHLGQHFSREGLSNLRPATAAQQSVAY
jgi:hypothetical protein